MRFKLLSLTAAVALSGPVLLNPLPAEAQRRPAERVTSAQQGSWDLLGETRVGFGVDRDVISIGRSETDYRNRSYDKLRLNAERGDVRMREVKLRYINGVTEDIPAERMLRAGESMILDLRERRSFLSQIELTYGARESGGGFLGRWNQPRVKVYGLNRGSGLPPRDLAGWDEIGQTLTGRGDDNVTITVGRREGRFGQLRLRNEGQPLTLRSAAVRFGNGETQTIRLDGQRLETGETTRGIDVDGQQRFIERIVLRFDRLSGPVRGAVTAFGNPAPGAGRTPPPATRVEPQRSWVPLGEQTVTFRGDRDVIKLGNDENWYRTRSFDKLHFISAQGDIQLEEIRITYINGYAETVRVNREITRSAALTLDLPGRRSYLKEIEMRYRTSPGSDARGLVRVFGEPVTR
jgi:hypothetical protein